MEVIRRFKRQLSGLWSNRSLILRTYSVHLLSMTAERGPPIDRSKMCVSTNEWFSISKGAISYSFHHLGSILFHSALGRSFRARRWLVAGSPSSPAANRILSYFSASLNLQAFDKRCRNRDRMFLHAPEAKASLYCSAVLASIDDDESRGRQLPCPSACFRGWTILIDQHLLEEQMASFWSEGQMNLSCFRLNLGSLWPPASSWIPLSGQLPI